MGLFAPLSESGPARRLAIAVDGGRGRRRLPDGEGRRVSRGRRSLKAAPGRFARAAEMLLVGGGILAGADPPVAHRQRRRRHRAAGRRVLRALRRLRGRSGVGARPEVHRRPAARTAQASGSGLRNDRRGCRCRPGACRTRCPNRRRAGSRSRRRRPQGVAWRTSSEPAKTWHIRSTSRRAPALVDVDEGLLEFGRGCVEPAISTGCGGDLAAQRLDALGLARHRAQHVEGVDVAAALPDAVQRRLPVEPRKP